LVRLPWTVIDADLKSIYINRSLLNPIIAGAKPEEFSLLQVDL